MAILIVDDHEDNRSLLERRLARAGYETVSAASGEQALDILRERNIALTLLDIQMPGMSGLDVLEWLRERRNAVELPVIMVTADPSSPVMVSAFEKGANDYVTKPLDLAVLVARIRTQLALRDAVSSLRKSEERYALAARGSKDGLWDWDLTSDRLFLSERWKAVIGYEDDEIGTSPEEWFRRVHPDDLERLRGDLDAHLAAKTAHLENEHRIRRKDGSYRWMLSRGLAVWDSGGKAVRIAGSQTDVTVGKIADPLTGLANRLLFIDRVDRAISAGRKRRESMFAVVCLDVDRFKNINDSLGHAAGDLLLQELAARLRQTLRGEDVIMRHAGSEQGLVLSRLGGDEFAILLEGVRGAADAVRVADRITQTLREPVMLDGKEMFITVSAGIALSSEGYDRPEDVLRDADTAMYFAKENGRSRFAIFDAGMRTRAVTRLQMELDLRNAITRNEIELYYQPIVEIRDGEVSGFEALVRWRHPERGLIHPGEFIPLAEETGLIFPLGLVILEQACRTIKHWEGIGPAARAVTLHVNLSPKQLMTPASVEDIFRTLDGFNLRGGQYRLKVEITESTLLESSDLVESAIRRLEERGIGVSIDDFGTGYSSLGQLQRFQIETLKIDRSFVNGVTQDDKAGIVKTIIGLARHMGIAVIAEGVETQEQAEQVLALGCERAQGYYFSVPVNAVDAENLLRSKAASQCPAFALATNG
ncbi:MAG: EAL domain-containing protein [Acidobacteria bacterium]|nr:EAL domain-containing protein [Acidobacteriota bacterium]